MNEPCDSINIYLMYKMISFKKLTSFFHLSEKTLIYSSSSRYQLNNKRKRDKNRQYVLKSVLRSSSFFLNFKNTFTS
jgi:hypothetical protein